MIHTREDAYAFVRLEDIRTIMLKSKRDTDCVTLLIMIMLKKPVFQLKPDISV